ncbi:MAG: GMC family oxidoreductase [Acidimicrobiia bacterium]
MKTVDVVTVGGGWTSAIMGWKLGAAGLSVVALEQGDSRYANPDFAHNHDSLRHSVRKAMMVDLAQETWTWRPNASAPSLPIRQYGAFHPGAGIGGSSMHWSAQLWRFVPADFEYRSFYEDKYGKSIIPTDSTVQDWGITYDELEPYYDAFEYDIGASGQAGNLCGEIQPGGNPFEGPRSRPYPVPPLVSPIWNDMFADAARHVGYHPFPQPAGILSRGYRDASGRTRSGCLYCGFCTRFGCEVDAKSSGVTTHLPMALKTANYEVRTGAHVLSVETDRSGMASGVRYIDASGNEQFQPARIVMLTAYTLTNVRLLLLSRSDRHPKGLGNDRDQVGRNMTYQMYRTPAAGIWDGKRFNSYMANTATMQVIFDLYGPFFDHSGLGFIGGAMTYTSPGEREPVTSAGAVPLDEDTAWGPKYKDALRKWDSWAAIQIQGESPAYKGNFFDLDPVYTDKWGKPLLRLTFDWTDNERRYYAHLASKIAAVMRAMNPTSMKLTPELSDFNSHDYNSTHITGGAIMGTDPSNSVTNNFGQVWDTPNLFVTGAALYPQNPGLNPTNTLCALAYRTGDAIVQRYLNRTGKLIDAPPELPALNPAVGPVDTAPPEVICRIPSR